MAFPSSTGSLPITLESGWEQARQIAGAIKAQSQNLVSQGQGAGISGNVIVSFAGYLDSVNAQLTSIAGISGMASYAQAQVGSSTLDVAAAFSAMQTAITNTIGWIKTNFPKDASGNLLFTQWGTGGQAIYTQFTSVQLSGFVTQLQALIATID